MFARAREAIGSCSCINGVLKKRTPLPVGPAHARHVEWDLSRNRESHRPKGFRPILSLIRKAIIYTLLISIAIIFSTMLGTVFSAVFLHAIEL